MTFWSDPIGVIGRLIVDLLARLHLPPNLITFISTLLGVVIVASFGLILVIFLIWLERKVAARFQDRFGPNRAGPYGLLQTFADIIKLITKEVKNRKEAIDQFKTGNRQDLVDQETAKLKILEVYLPQQMSPQEIEPIVAKIIQSGLTEFGAVMAKVMAQTKGQAEGSLVATIVRKKLT